VDAEQGVQPEAVGALPGEHVGDGLVVEDAASLDDTEHDAAVGLLAEEAVEDHDVEVGIQGGAEAVEVAQDGFVCDL
jgi:hypothetical protein